MKRVARPNLVEHSMSRVLREPPSVRKASSVIVSATAAVVVGSGLLMRLLDPSEYENIWVALWWSLQTVTTVGYGDVTPTHRSGRIVGAFVMFEGIALVTIVVAAITSIFVARAARERDVGEVARVDSAEARIEARLDGIDERLGRLEELLRR